MGKRKGKEHIDIIIVIYILEIGAMIKKKVKVFINMKIKEKNLMDVLLME